MYYVIFDTETNGLDITTSDILSLGWIKVYVDYETYAICKHIEQYVMNDNIHNSPESFAINNISDEFRHENGAPIDQILDEFRSDITGCILYAYSCSFDIDFLKKYDPSIFDNVLCVKELRINETESVINAVQRIIAEINNNEFNIRPINNRYHTAYDDCYCELIIFFHDILKLHCVKELFEHCDYYVPCVGSGCYKNKHIDEITDNVWMDWFLNIKIGSHEDYLRRYIRSHGLFK